jgi:riboflavin synthase
MFTGIIEALGTVQHIAQEGTNFHFTIASSISNMLKVDQSVAHDGTCLTVVECGDGYHVVTAIEETMRRTRLGQWQVGHTVNLERAMRPDGLLDGHIVQGHVDMVGTCIAADDADGSWYYRFRYTPGPDHIVVDKGSICINGVSLTVVDPQADEFSVAIIPYTYQHTNFAQLAIDQAVNLEFDIIGKYIARHLALYLPKGA